VEVRGFEPLAPAVRRHVRGYKPPAQTSRDLRNRASGDFLRIPPVSRRYRDETGMESAADPRSLLRWSCPYL
jgi:hypothetical protein